MEDQPKKYLMPELTEKQREEMIEDLESKLSEETFSLYGYAARISLAVLTAEPSVWIKPNSLGFPRMAQIEAVTIPFVPEYPVPLFSIPPLEVLKPIKLPTPNENLSEKEKEIYQKIIKEVEEALIKQGHTVKK